MQVLPLPAIGNPTQEKGMVEEGTSETVESDGEFFLAATHGLTCTFKNLTLKNNFDRRQTPILPRPISAVDSPPPNFI